MLAVILAGGSLATEPGRIPQDRLTRSDAATARSADVASFGDVVRDMERAGAIVVAADGGLRHAEALGLTVTVVIGDMDSADRHELGAMARDGTRVFHHPRRKDSTDLELALDYVCGAGADEAVIVGGFGGRWDMTFANVLLPTRNAYRNVRIRHIAASWQAVWLHGPDTWRLSGAVGDVVSLVPLGTDVTGVATEGLDYPLRGETLPAGSTRGVSNTIAVAPGSVTVSTGHLLCITTARHAQELST